MGISASRSGQRSVDPATAIDTNTGRTHAYLRYPAGKDLQLGDMISCGISHPCTAFDKWKFIPVVNDQYDVTDAIVTFF